MGTLNRIGFKDFNGREKKSLLDISHHAAQETDGARRRDVARRACGSNAGHENGRVAKPERTGRDRIVGRGRRKHATRGDPNEWGDDIPLWESHPSRSHAPAREKTPRQRRQRREKEQVERPQKTCVGENCKKRQKSGRYLRKPGSTEEEYLCFTCWAKEHVKNAGRQCFICDKTNAGGCWYKSKLHKDKDLCTRCYERERRDRLQASGNLKCWCCGALTTSAKWRTSKDKSEGKKDLCNKCYLKECRATKTAMETGKSCCVCRTQITTVWKQSTVSKGPDGKTDICYQCHRREPGQAALE